MQNIELEGAKVYYLLPDNQFATKIFLKRQDTTTNAMIYVPFPMPDAIQSFRIYAALFQAILSMDLGIDEKYIKFFANKERI